MPLYRFEAMTAQGETLKGEMDAASSAAVIAHLHQQGHMPLLAQEKTPSLLPGLSWEKFSGAMRLSTRDIAFFTQELATLLQAGLTLERALGLLAELNSGKSARGFIDAVLVRIRAGDTLSRALAAQKDILPRAYIGMVHAGEAGGGKALDQTLQRLAGYLGRMQQMRDAMASALLYPAILAVVAALAVTLMLVFVLPQFEPLFKDSGAPLPFATQLVLFVSHALRDYGILLLVLMIAAAFGMRHALRREDMQMRRDALVLRLPRIGRLLAEAEVARFCHTLAALQASGLSLAMALPIAQDSFSNRLLMAAAERVTARVRAGELLSAALDREPLFPALTRQMVRIGEEAGQLDTLLARAADIHDRDVRRALERLMTLVAPALTILIGVVIAGIIAAILSAILSVNDLAV